jgi:hypothetical protein
MATLGRSRLGAHTRAGPGFPGPRHGRAVRGAPASRARGTTRWRGGDGGYGKDGGTTGPCMKRWHGGRRGNRRSYGRAIEGSSVALGITPAAGERKGEAVAELTEGSLVRGV